MAVILSSKQNSLLNNIDKINNYESKLKSISQVIVFLAISFIILAFITLDYTSSYIFSIISTTIAFILLILFLKSKYNLYCYRFNFQPIKSQLSAGYKGERSVLNTLKNLDDNYIILADITLHLLDSESQIDFIVIGKSKLFVIEAKNFVGTLTGSSSDKYLVKTDKKGNTCKIYNPIKQNFVHMFKLKSFLEQNSINEKVEPLLVFLNNCLVDIKNINMPILDLKHLCEFIIEHDNLNPIRYEFKQYITNIIIKSDLNYI